VLDGVGQWEFFGVEMEAEIFENSAIFADNLHNFNSSGFFCVEKFLKFIHLG
jgi:hypothetical protein